MLPDLPADVINELTTPLRPTLRLIEVAPDTGYALNSYSGSDRIVNDVTAGGRCELVAKFVQGMRRDDPRIRADVRARISLEIVATSRVVIQCASRGSVLVAVEEVPEIERINRRRLPIEFFDNDVPMLSSWKAARSSDLCITQLDTPGEIGAEC